MATALYVGTYNSGTGEIDWLDRHEIADIQTLTITDGIGSEADTMSVMARIPVSFVTQEGNELPLAGQICRVVLDGVKLFEGVITAVGNTWLVGGSSIEFSIACGSYVILMNRHLVVDRLAEEGRAGARIRGYLSTFAESFSQDMSNIANGPIVPEATYDYQTMSSVIGSLANMVGYVWYVDFDRRVHFFPSLDREAPLTAVDVDQTDQQQEDFAVGDFAVTQDASDIANVIILKDYASRGQNRQSHQTRADGMTSFFSLPMPPFSLEDTDVYVRPEGGDSWEQRLVIEDPLDGRPESVVGSRGMAYLCVFNWGVRFPTSDMPQAGDEVKVDYNPEVPDRVMVVFDEDSIREFARREGGDGHHELAVSVSDFRVSNERPVEALGYLILSRKAWPVVQGSFTVRTTNYGEWRPGQRFTIESDKRDIFDLKHWVASDYTEKLPLTVWVDRVDRTFVPTDDGVLEVNVVSFTSVPSQSQ